MELARAYKFRVYPDAAMRAKIEERLILAQHLYTRFLTSQSHLIRMEK